MAERDSKNNNQNRWGRFSKVASLWVLLFLIPLILIQMMDSREVGTELDYTRLSQELERGNIERVVFIEGQRLEGELRSPISGEQGQTTNFFTQLPVAQSEELLTRFEEAGVTISARQADRDWW